MKNILNRVITISLLTLLMVACSDDKKVLNVGSKDFAESYLLAEMIAQLAENEGVSVERNFPFGNTQKNLEGIKQGVIDVYPEYNGTALVFLGQAPTSDGDASSAKVQKLFGPLGLEFRGKFGFSNDYAIVMTREHAEELGVTNISDLASLTGDLNIAVDVDFPTRAADGLKPMLRHYGINNLQSSEFPMGSKGKAEIIESLLNGKSDVAELYVTDGQIAEYDLVVLKDDKTFFPVYQPGPLVRTAALEDIPQLGGVLDKLNGAITPEAMQAMNKAVDLDAKTYASVASQFLVSKGLLPEGSSSGETQKLVVAVGPDMQSSGETAMAVHAIRSGFTGEDIKIQQTSDPLDVLSQGEARMALVGAESFFDSTGGTPVAKGVANAFAVVGFKTGHLISRRNGGASSIGDMRKIATGSKGSGSDIVLGILLASTGLSDSVEVVNESGDVSALIAGINSGQYDGAFVMTTQGSREIKAAMKDTSVKLIDISEWAEGGYTANHSYVRPATIAAQTYTSQFLPVSSISTQLVLASPIKSAEVIGSVGPGTTGDSSVVPVSGDKVKTISQTLVDGSAVDPSLPIHVALLPKIEVVDKSLPFQLDISIVNIIMILFVIWVIYLCFLPSPREFTLSDDE